MVNNKSQKDTTAKSIQDVITTEQRWVKAHIEMDIDVIDEILSDDYRQLRDDGTFIDKKQLLESYSSGMRHWEVAESYDYDVQMFSDCAILTGTWKGIGTNANEKFNYLATFISFYKFTKGKWKLHLETSIPITSTQ